MKSKKFANFLLLIGGTLLASALLLFAYNQSENRAAGQAAAETLATMQYQLSRQEAPKPSSAAEEMTEVEIDGYSYIGCLSIPALERELPIMSQWDDARLKIAPCRQFGATHTEDLVIAGHNYQSHFGGLASLQQGDQILFTDMEGTSHIYAIAEVCVLPPTAVREVEHSPWDLVLYTCTPGGQKRIVVGANRVSAFCIN